MSREAATATIGHNDPVIQDLRDLLGDRLSTAAAVRDQHGRGESYHLSVAPDAVAFVESTEEVAELVKICARHRCPVIPFGTGTSLEGHVAALKGGVSVDLSRMNEVLQVNSDDLDCRVQAGVTRKQLNDYLRDTGLFFPIDPGADASLGGMAATRASGTNAVRYGTMRELVMGLTVVLSDGRIVRTGGRARKSSAGYDLTRLLVGSEGTLGVITELQLRLFGIPEAISAAVCSFPTLEGAVNSVILTIQMGIPVARIELLDEIQMDAVNRYSDLDYPVQPTLFFEFHGSTRGVEEHAETVGGICAELGGGDFRWATQQEDRSKLWQARHDAYYACLALRPGARGWPTDVCVPISRLAECLLETRREIDAAGLLAPIVGHVGDGNFHVVFVLDPDDKEAWERAEAVNRCMVERALAVGGTCTGEHGVGYGKMRYLEKEQGEAVEVMRQVKRALDPDNILNPGKIVIP
jgi:D-lactate dehydrogenase (cytochrome)